jgi:hypothetical protein
MAVKRNNVAGITCGKRSNGERCVLWDDESLGDKGFEWFTAAEFAINFGK